MVASNLLSLGIIRERDCCHLYVRRCHTSREVQAGCTLRVEEAGQCVERLQERLLVDLFRQHISRRMLNEALTIVGGT